MVKLNPPPGSIDKGDPTKIVDDEVQLKNTQEKICDDLCRIGGHLPSLGLPADQAAQAKTYLLQLSDFAENFGVMEGNEREIIQTAQTNLASLIDILNQHLTQVASYQGQPLPLTK